VSESDVRVELEDYLRADHRPEQVFRDRRGRAICIVESAVDVDRLRVEQTPLVSLARRVRVVEEEFRRERASYLLPVELIRIAKEDPASAAGLETPLGKVVHDHGLWLQLAPGLEEVGVNDRGDVVLRRREAYGGDPTVGPVRNSVNTVIAGRARRLVTRTDRVQHERDVAEAEAWLKALAATSGEPTRESRFKCAAVDYRHRGNIPYLTRTTQLNFFDPDDPEMLEMAALVARRYEALGRAMPSVDIISLMGLPADPAEHDAFLEQLRAAGHDPGRLGIPTTLRESQFADPSTGGCVSSNFVLFTPLAQLPERITIITVNTDYHGEVKSRTVLSPLMAIMSLVDIISAHAGAAVLNRRGTATSFTGPTGTGKTTAGAFWAERNEKYRREELRRRYAIDLARELGKVEGDEAVRFATEELMPRVGILCQEDWIEILRTERGDWRFYPTERAMYARTGGFPGLRFILAENEPLLENAAADFGGGGSLATLGQVTHEYFPERLFYLPEAGHVNYDRAPRAITANVFLERNPGLDFCAKRVGPEEAIHWLLLGRTPQGKFEPLYNAYPDFSGLLMERGVVGEKLAQAFEAAKAGGHPPATPSTGEARLGTAKVYRRPSAGGRSPGEAARAGLAALGAGDATLGAAIFDKLEAQVRLWLAMCREVPTYIVNGAPGLEITQDINWLLSEHSDAFGDWSHVTVAEFQAFMRDRYGVTYGPRGEWTHVDRHG
jgi:hypothetical protein